MATQASKATTTHELGHFMGERHPAGTQVLVRPYAQDPTYFELRTPDGYWLTVGEWDFELLESSLTVEEQERLARADGFSPFDPACHVCGEQTLEGDDCSRRHYHSWLLRHEFGKEA